VKSCVKVGRSSDRVVRREMTAGTCWSSWHVVMMVGVISAKFVCCGHFTDHYAVQVDGGVHEAQRVAAQHGLVFVNEVCSSVL